jgi:serine protease Do
MNDFNNEYNNENQGSSNSSGNSYYYGQQNYDPQSGQPYYSRQNYGQQDFNKQSAGQNVNEFSYNPKPKKPMGRKVLTGVIAVLCVAAIATTSIAGYTLVTGKNLVNTDSSSSSVTKDSDSTAAASNTTVDRTNLPTIEQLSTPSDAMTIPEIVKSVSPSVVGVSCILDDGTSTGSGIIFSEDGYIITNAHVIEDAKSISVVLPSSYNEKGDTVTDNESTTSDDSDSTAEDNLTYTAELVGSDEQTDIAVLKIDKTGLTAATFGTSSELVVGEASIIIGNPLGLDLANSVTSGIISALNRTITVEDRTMNLIQTDAAVNNGNSGGPLINAYGQVVGITSAKVSSSVAEGLGFAIPIDEALPIINDLLEHGYVTGRPSLGITGSDISSSYSSYYGIPQGFLVASVSEGSGAEKAGIQKNDIVIAINDTMITSISELNEIKNKFEPGDTVTLTLYRNGKKLDVEVELGESTEESSTTSTDTDTDDQTQDNQSNDGYSYNNPFGNYNYGYGYGY